MKKGILFSMGSLILGTIFAQNNVNANKFKQLKEELATPNVYRTASGAPGHEYYQQKADYVINVELDDAKQIVKGDESITYKNNSPDKLDYLWIQLDQNMRAKDSDTKKVDTKNIDKKMSFAELAEMHNQFDGGFKLDYVKDGSGKDLKYTINKTMMRIDLPKPLLPGSTATLKLKWWYNVNNRDEIGGRSGYEYFEEEDNYLYTIAQFYPRMAVYNEVEGWQNKQFLGSGEFTLTFGDYKVNITVPSDHIVGATGTLTNASSVLTSEQRSRFSKAQNEYVNPVMIVTQEEAEEIEKKKADGTKTWSFSATNVRDFAFASSRKFIWDAMAVEYNGKKTLAMSYYPKEGNPLWEQYSTKVVAHTIESYSRHTCDYPYPAAISVHSKSIGMEYPMICFNGGRPNKDGTYSERTKYAMIGVIIHEVGHNFFPMIINSDERQWTWMDEGLNTFTQYMCEQEWERGYPSRRGPAYKIVDYMKGDKKGISPIMTNSESILQFGNNAYGKPATALNILRETVMGRELFDFAFKTYAERWKFKHPTPADFFRTMEDASGVDLDWFWRGWFYTTDHVDIAINNVEWFKIDTKDPQVEKAFEKEMEARIKFKGDENNKEFIKETYNEKDPSINDFYNSYDPFEVLLIDEVDYKKYLKKLDEKDLEILNGDYNYYNISFENKGGLVMPLILNFTFKDGSTEEVRIPAEIWRRNNYNVTKAFFFEKEMVSVELDPWLETADTDMNNNNWPPKMLPSKFDLYKSKKYGWGADGRENPMQRLKKNEELKNKTEKE
ncbi:M1 family metallopeptidase [Vicingus serpentipes]|uniref:M1 family metallopeptidase n=1 Tax=Vicingus serpentipes TaxID=1926625 RepID=A0A5C6RRY5_9FLAO|nr:M1 family metallopeptidase [Vicingus serpentipes]TXB65186.1 M1 family metallopeptidase [Vicingus serpentipes]